LADLDQTGIKTGLLLISLQLTNDIRPQDVYHWFALIVKFITPYIY